MTEEQNTTTTPEEWGPLPCQVRHEDAGGQCRRPGAVRVHGLLFCAEHGREAHLGAALEEQHEVDTFLERFRGRGTNPPVEKALRAALAQRGEGWVSDRAHYDALTRAYPNPPERLRREVHDWLLDERPGCEEPVVDYLLRALALTNKLMRLSYEEELMWMVEKLEEERESLAAQAAAALEELKARQEK